MKSHRISKIIKLYCLAIGLSACSAKEVEITDTPNNSSTNILLIIGDDIGIDSFNGFQSFGSQKAKTPTLDMLVQNGLLFTQVYANPLCSPTRATILSGQYGFRTGVTGLPTANAGGIKTSTTSIHQFIEQKTANRYADAVIGKWHLSDNSNGGALNPTNMGIDYFAGFLSGTVQNYSSWSKVINGQSSNSTKYTTTDFTDESITWIKQQTKPWFLWLAYNAAHTPFHTPPSNLISASPANNNLSMYLSAIEAMDSEINRLLQNIPKSQLDNTLIIFIGDNGTPNQVAQSPFSRTTAKSTLFEGGIRVPMIVSGKGISRKETDNSIINSTDLFATIADIAGANTTTYQDSKSFKSLFTEANSFNRDWVYSEINSSDNSNDENGEALRDKQYKYMKLASGLEYLFDLSNDPTEQKNLAKDTKYQSVKANLSEKIISIKK